jgi:hypothetical protein
MPRLRLLASTLPEPERPTRDADQRGGILYRQAKLAPPGAQLRRQRIALLAPEFGLGRLQGHGNTRYQKGYMTQTIGAC